LKKLMQKTQLTRNRGAVETDWPVLRSKIDLSGLSGLSAGNFPLSADLASFYSTHPS
jgi:hypothetical protein